MDQLNPETQKHLNNLTKYGEWPYFKAYLEDFLADIADIRISHPELVNISKESEFTGRLLAVNMIENLISSIESITGEVPNKKKTYE